MDSSNLEGNSRVDFDKTSNFEGNSRVNFDKTSNFEGNSRVNFDKTSNLDGNSRVNFDRENVDDIRVYKNGTNSPNHNNKNNSNNQNKTPLRRRNTPDQDMNWRERKKPLDEIIERDNQLLTATKCV